ncbi:MAG: hypothetical protein KKF68_03475 [Nanoarchaeota archaeon]|nr:hypothetical protein [Nanoarchaeota archaeon]
MGEKKRFKKTPVIDEGVFYSAELASAYNTIKKGGYGPTSRRGDKQYIREIARGLLDIGRGMNDEKTIKMGVELYEKIGEKAPEEKEGSLETRSRIAAASIIVSFAMAFYLLSTNITGSAVSNLTQTSTNLFGVVLFVLGLVLTYLYFKRK